MEDEEDLSIILVLSTTLCGHEGTCIGHGLLGDSVVLGLLVRRDIDQRADELHLENGSHRGGSGAIQVEREEPTSGLHN
jgi:hypothetical protein